MPVVPRRGSVGSSGDLAPLAHLALVLIGEGEAFWQGERMPGGDALRRAGLEPVVLAEKEGLALINGTHLMASCGGLALLEARRVLEAAIVAAALSLEAFMGSTAPFDDRIHALRPPARTATCRGDGCASCSPAARSWRATRTAAACRIRTPSAASPRCSARCPTPSTTSRRTLALELTAVTDNPLVFPDEGDVRVGRQLPRAAAVAGARPPRAGPVRARLVLGAAHVRAALAVLRGAAALPDPPSRASTPAS